MNDDRSTRTRERIRAQHLAGVPPLEIAKVLRLSVGYVGHVLGELPDDEALDGFRAYTQALADSTP